MAKSTLGIKITTAHGKGGVGKSTIAMLLAEYLNFCGITVKIVDADPNQTLQSWVDNVEDSGRTVSTPKDPVVTIVDTAGMGGAATRHMAQANTIIAPFKLNFADSDLLASWFSGLDEDLRSKFVFIPNMVSVAKEQQLTLDDVRGALRELKLGLLVRKLKDAAPEVAAAYDGVGEGSPLEHQPLIDALAPHLDGQGLVAALDEMKQGKLLDLLIKGRDAVYPPLLAGHEENFFARKDRKYKDAQEEASAVCKAILAHAGVEV